MAYKKIPIRPTMLGLPTPSAAGGAWWRMNLMRFSGGVLQPIGGWVSIDGLTNISATRRLLSWKDTTEQIWTAAASLDQILVQGLETADITPDDWAIGEAAQAMDGYGMGLYGASTYGTRRPVDIPTGSLGDWVSMDNFGEILVVCGSADGRILWWSPTTDGLTGKLTPIPNAPTNCKAVAVTEERYIVALGANGDPRSVMWCDQEDPTTWAPAIENSAGSLELRTQTGAICGARVREGLLIFCDDDIHVLRWVGAPFFYGLDRVGEGCGPIGPNAVAPAGGRAAWMGKSGFFTWDGAPQTVVSDVQDYVFNNINVMTQALACGAFNGTFMEAWWFYPTADASENNSYVIYNLVDRSWSAGTLARSAIAMRDAQNYPLMADPSGQVYHHEWGWLADGQSRVGDVFAESGALDISDGASRILIRQMFADVSEPDAIRLKIIGQDGPSDADQLQVDMLVDRADGIVDEMAEAKLLRIRLESAKDIRWRLGVLRGDIVQGSGW
jgi:hypothetical protein